MQFTFLDEWQGPAARQGQASDLSGQADLMQGSALEARGLIATAQEAPQDIAELEELSRLLKVPTGVLAAQPQLVRREWLGRALAKNPRLMRFASQGAVNKALAAKHAQEALRVKEAFESMALLLGESQRKKALAAQNGLRVRRLYAEAGLLADNLDWFVDDDLANAAEEDLDNEAGEDLANAAEADLDKEAEEAEFQERLQSRSADARLGDAESGAKLAELGASADLEYAFDGLNSQESPAGKQAEINSPAESENLEPDKPEEIAAESEPTALNSQLASRDAALAGQGVKHIKSDDPLDFYLDPFKNFANGWIDLLRGVIGAGKSLSDLTAGSDSGLSKWFNDWLKTLKDAEFETSRVTSFGGQLARDVVRAAPQYAAQIALWLSGGAAVSTGFMGTQIYGGDYLRLREEGISEGNAIFAGLVDAALQSSLERLGMKWILGGSGKLTGEAGRKALESLAAQFNKNGALRIASGAARGFASEGVTEALQYAPEYFTTWWARSSKQSSDLGERLDWTMRKALDGRNLAEGTAEAIYEGLVGGILGAGAGAGRTAYLRRKMDPEWQALIEEERQLANKVVERLALDQAINSAREAVAQISDPEAARQIAANSLPENMDTVYIHREDLSNLLAADPANINPVLDALNVDSEFLADFLQGNGILGIRDLSSLIVAQSPQAQALREMLRFGPEAPTLGEAKAWEPAQRISQVLAILNQEEDEDEWLDPQEEEEARERRRKAEARALNRMSDRIDKQVQRIEKELQEAGMAPTEAQANAALVRAHALAWWKRYGIDGAALLGAWQIERGSEADPTALGRPEAEPESASPEEMPEWMNGPTEQRPRQRVIRGQVAISQAKMLIRLFSKRDVSTFSHEAAHVFLEDLLRLVKGGRDSLFNNFSSQLRELFQEDASYGQELTELLAEYWSQEGSAENLRGFAQALREKAEALEGPLEDLGNTLEEAAALEREQGARPQLLEGEESGAKMESPEWRQMAARIRLSRQVYKLARQNADFLDAMELASVDLDSFAANAGLDLALLQRALDAKEDKDPEALAAYVKLQEATAKAFLHYLAAGKTPSPKLASAMGRLSQWLSNLWRRYKNVAPESLDTALIGAFDRLLASDADLRLQAGIDAFVRREFDFTHLAGLAEDDAEKLRALLRRAQARAIENGERLIRKREEKFRKNRVREILKELAQEPFWILAENAHFNFEQVAAILGQERATALRVAAPRIFKGQAQDLNEAANEAAYDSVEAMLAQLHERLALKHESRKALAGQQADAELAALSENREFQNVNEELGAYLDQADLALARIVAQAHLQSQQEIDRWIDNSRVPKAIINNLASERMRRMPLRQLKPRALERLLNECLSRRDQLLAKREPAAYMRAMAESQEARVIYAIMEDAHRAQKQLRDLRKRARKIADAPAGAYGALQTEALRLIFDGFGLGKMRAPVDYAYVRALPDLIQELMTQADAEGGMLSFPDWLLERRYPQAKERRAEQVIRLDALSMAQLEELENLIKFVAKSGREARKNSKAAEEAFIRETVQTCATAMEALPDRPNVPEGGPRDFIRKLADKGFAATDILLWQFRKADGLSNILGGRLRDPNKPNAPVDKAGPMEAIWRRIVAGEERVRGWHDKLGRALAPHLKQLQAAQKRLEARFGKRMTIADKDGKIVEPPKAWQKAYNSQYWTAEMIFALAVHLGNASNIQRLVSGYGQDLNQNLFRTLFGTEVASQVALAANMPYQLDQSSENGLLTLADWQAIQGIWDSIALLWPDTKAVHEKMFGFAPQSVGASPLKVRTAEGATYLEGGYFPVAYDPRVSDRVGAWSEQEDLLARNEAMFTTPSAKRGHTKARTKKAPGLPILLNLSPISRHIDEAARFIELAEAVRQADRITQNPNFAETFRRKFSKDDYDAIRPNLRGLLRNEKLPDVIAWLESKMRKFVVPWGLAWNFNVALMQSAAIFPAMGDLGYRPMLKAAGQLIRHPSLVREIWQASPYLISRMKNLDQDLVRGIQAFSLNRPPSIEYRGKSYTYDDLVDLGMKMIVGVDAGVAATVWLAAYTAKINELRDNPPQEPSTNPNQPQSSPSQPQSSPEQSQPQAQEQPQSPAQPTLNPQENPPQVSIAGQDTAQQRSLPPEEAPQGSSEVNLDGQPRVEDGASQDTASESEASPDSDPLANLSEEERQNVDQWLRELEEEERRYNQERAQRRQSAQNSPRNPQADPDKPNGENGPQNSAESENTRKAQETPNQPNSGPEITLNSESSLPENQNKPNPADPNPTPRRASADESLGDSSNSGDPSQNNQNDSAAADQNNRDASLSSLIDFTDRFHDQAARFADQIVKQSNPDYDPSSRSTFLRSRGMMRLFNQFSSALTLFASRNHFMLTAMRKGKISKPRYAQYLGNEFLLPAVFLSLIYGASRDWYDDEYDPLKSFVALTMDQFSMAIPIFGSLAADLSQNALGMGPGNYRRGDLRTSLDSPIEVTGRAASSIRKLAANKSTKEERKAAIYALLDLASFSLRIPVSKVARKAERGYDQWQRGEGSPASIILPKAGK